MSRVNCQGYFLLAFGCLVLVFLAVVFLVLGCLALAFLLAFLVLGFRALVFLVLGFRARVLLVLGFLALAFWVLGFLGFLERVFLVLAFLVLGFLGFVAPFLLLEAAFFPDPVLDFVLVGLLLALDLLLAGAGASFRTEPTRLGAGSPLPSGYRALSGTWLNALGGN